jgi:elongation factor G
VLEPLDEGTANVVEVVQKPTVPALISNAIRESLTAGLSSGTLCGYPLVHMEASVVDYSYDPQNVDEVVYKIATNHALRMGLEQAKPVLMEPIMRLEVVVPQEFSGTIVSDINGRRGQVLGLDMRGHLQVVQAQIPLSSLFGYETDIRSLSQGRASSSVHFSHYALIPKTMQDKILGIVT